MKLLSNFKTRTTLFALLLAVLGFILISYLFNFGDSRQRVRPAGLGAGVIEILPDTETIAKYFYYLRDWTQKPKVSALAYLVGDLNTGEVILSRNADKKLAIASVSKLMTALVASGIAEAGEEAKVSRAALATYGSNGNLRTGEKIKISNLLYPLLLESSNDAAAVLAEHFGLDIFITKMNQEAARLKMENTSFADPSGLSSLNQSSALDLFRLAGYLKQKKPDILAISKNRSYTDQKHTWYNTSQFLKNPGYLGGKSGFTEVSKETGVFLFDVLLSKTSSRPIAIVLLKSPDRKKDTENILKYLQKNVYYGGEENARIDWVREKIGVPDIREPDYVTILAGGDLMLARGVRNSVVRNFGGDYSAFLEKLSILKKFDIVFANLEGTASDKGQDLGNLYSFRMDPSVVPALRGAGISILSVANNHVGDWGLPAYIDTLSRLKENEVLYTGGGLDEKDAEKPAIIEKYGMKIGFLGFSDKGPAGMAAREDKTGVLLADNPRLEEIIKNASAQVDYLIVSFHWGEEYQKKHNARQETLAHKAIDNGAKIVVGHHPHVIQDTGVYSQKDCTQSSCVGFIAYSLGNFIFDQGFSEDTMQGMLLGIKIWRDGNISIQKNIVKLNSKTFQPEKIIYGKEEKVNFR